MKPCIVDDTKTFHHKFGLGVELAGLVNGLSEEVWAHRMRMTKEECSELVEAIELRDPLKIARESIDVIFVVVGTLLVLGIPFYPVWRAVMKANMSKTRAQGNAKAAKPVKPPGWQSPDRDIRLALRIQPPSADAPASEHPLVVAAVAKAQGQSGAPVGTIVDPEATVPVTPPEETPADTTVETIATATASTPTGTVEPAAK